MSAGHLVADAVLREGRVLYPYRASAAKNQLRWQFGVLVPRPFHHLDGSDRWYMTTTCLLDRAAPTTAVGVRARFARSRARQVLGPAGVVPAAEIDGEMYTTFDETVEEQIDAGPVPVSDLLSGAVRTAMSVVAADEEVAVSADGSFRVLRRTEELEVALTLSAAARPGPYGLVEVTGRLENVTEWPPQPAGPDQAAGGRGRRAAALGRSLLSAHLLLSADQGRWLSAVDPPEFAGPRRDTDHEGCFPVLIGDDRVMLAAPIILYDHPEVAPESAGDFCDATEIDEILALRTLTLTEAEKREARATDEQAAAILDRCDNLPPEIWERLHGAVRSLQPAAPEPGSESVIVGSAEVRAGTRVVLHPVRTADAQDLFLDGRPATVSGVFRDLDGQVHVAVVLDDDPGADLHEWYGRFRYFRPTEIEVAR